MESGKELSSEYVIAFLVDEYLEKKLIKKWSPILDTLNIPDYLRKFAVNYAEKYSNLNKDCLFPICMKILSKLKFGNSEMEMVDNLEPVEISKKFERKDISDVSNDERLIIIQKLENDLIEMLAEKINSELINGTKIKIGLLVKNISLGEGFNPIMSITSEYKING